MECEVQTGLGPVKIDVQEKPIKSVRLRVTPKGEVALSIPLGTSEKTIQELLKGREGWIEERLQIFKKTKPIEKEGLIRSGSATRILGRQLYIKVIQSPQKKIERADRFLLIYTPRPNNFEAVEAQFRNWWQKTSKAFFLERINQLFPIFARHGVQRPKLMVKKLQTLWGSCSRSKGNITLNYYLFKAPVNCIEYVIFHELLHFLYPHHDENFKTMLTVYMPDWQERRRLLDFEIIQGF